MVGCVCAPEVPCSSSPQIASCRLPSILPYPAALISHRPPPAPTGTLGHYPLTPARAFPTVTHCEPVAYIHCGIDIPFSLYPLTLHPIIAYPLSCCCYNYGTDSHIM